MLDEDLPKMLGAAMENFGKTRGAGLLQKCLSNFECLGCRAWAWHGALQAQQGAPEAEREHDH